MMAWIAGVSEKQGGREKLREARLVFDKALGVGTILGPIIGGTFAGEKGDIEMPVLLVSAALVGYAVFIMSGQVYIACMLR